MPRGALARRGAGRGRVPLRCPPAGLDRRGVGLDQGRPRAGGPARNARAARGRRDPAPRRRPQRRGLAGGAPGRAPRPLRASDRGRAALPPRPADGRDPPGSAGGRDGRRRGARSRPPGRRGAPGRDARAATSARSRRRRSGGRARPSARSVSRRSRPIQPMLAQSAEDVPAAFAKHPPRGDRVEDRRRADPDPPARRRRAGVHAERSPTSPSGCPRSSRRSPRIDVEAAVLDAEAVALRRRRATAGVRRHDEPLRQPHPRRTLDELRDEIPLRAMVFDVLHLDGVDLIDLPASERFAALEARLPEDAARAAHRDRRRRRGRPLPRRRARARARRRDGEGARRAVRGRAARGAAGSR